MNHVGTEWFKTMAGIDIVHVPYRGDAPVAADVTSGTLGVSFVSSNVAIPLIKAGKLRALAVPSRQRIAVLPDVPTMAESGYPDFDLQPWTGLFGPAGLDKSIVAAAVGGDEGDPGRARRRRAVGRPQHDAGASPRRRSSATRSARASRCGRTSRPRRSRGRVR